MFTSITLVSVDNLFEVPVPLGIPSSAAPIRLSFHINHYNSVMIPKVFEEALLNSRPGYFEDCRIRTSSQTDATVLPSSLAECIDNDVDDDLWMSLLEGDQMTDEEEAMHEEVLSEGEMPSSNVRISGSHAQHMVHAYAQQYPEAMQWSPVVQDEECLSDVEIEDLNDVPRRRVDAERAYSVNPSNRKGCNGTCENDCGDS